MALGERLDYVEKAPRGFRLDFGAIARPDYIGAMGCATYTKRGLSWFADAIGGYNFGLRAWDYTATTGVRIKW